MADFRIIENELNIAKYGLNRTKDPRVLWDNIKDNRELLSWAITPRKDKFGQKDLVTGLAICDSMLIDFENVDKELYQKLIDLIYSNTDIARLVLDGYSNGGTSFLLMSLWNHSLKLTEEQKAFAVNEAMNKIGTTRYKKYNDEYSKMLDEKGISDDDTDYIDIDGSINPIGKKAKHEYFSHLFSIMSTTQAHGRGCYDIRYQILRNPNWTLEEKKQLIMDFWYDDEAYNETLDLWQWGIANDDANYKNSFFPLFDKDMIFDYTYETLLKFYGDKKTTDRIWDEINFCRQMCELRAPQEELIYRKSFI